MRASSVRPAETTLRHLHRVCRNGWRQSSRGVNWVLRGEMCHAEDLALAPEREEMLKLTWLCRVLCHEHGPARAAWALEIFSKGMKS